MSTPLGCPDCRTAAHLESVEEIQAHYRVKDVVRSTGGTILFEYDESSEPRVFDETAIATGEFWCTGCDTALAEDELVALDGSDDAEDDEFDDDDVEDDFPL